MNSPPPLLRNPIRLFAVGQLAYAAQSILFAIADPHDAALGFVPQAVGGCAVAIALFAFAGTLSTRSAAVSRARLRAVLVAAGGLTIATLGWAWYAHLERNGPWEYLTAAILVACGAFIEALAVWWGAKRLSAGGNETDSAGYPGDSGNATVNTPGAPAPPVAEGDHPRTGTTWRALSWVVAVVLGVVGASGLAASPGAGGRVLGGITLVAALIIARGLWATKKPKAPESLFDR